MGLGGYRLVFGPFDEFDLDAFVGAAQAGLAAAGGDRIVRLRAALALWTGVPASEFADEDWAQPIATHWEEHRRVLVETLAADLVEAGRWNEAIALLDDERAELTFRERPVELLMRALAGSGRLTDALRALARFRTLLATEVGVEPSARLRDLERQLLGIGDVPAAGRAVASPATSMVGREHDIADVRRALGAHRLVTLTGVGGVGKTRLGDPGRDDDGRPP